MSWPDMASEAVNAAFAAFGVAADYTAPGGGAAIPCTVIKDAADREVRSDFGRPVMQGTTLDVRVSEVAAPAADGTFGPPAVVVAGQASLATTFIIVGDPATPDDDSERLIRRCTVR